jgi:cytochrome c553
VQAQSYGALGLAQVHAQATAPACVPGDRLAAALEAINQRLCALEGKNGTAPAAPVQPPANPFQPIKAPAIPAAFGKCAACHTGNQSKGGFAMFDAPGKLAVFSERQLRMILTKSHTGTMPPPNNREGIQPLTDAEVGDIAAWADSQK